MITIKEAYDQWSKEASFRVLAAKTHIAWCKVWSHLDDSKPCSDITVRILVNAMVKLPFIMMEDRVRACSVMVHVLNYVRKKCQDMEDSPVFTYQDVLREYERRMNIEQVDRHGLTAETRKRIEERDRRWADRMGLNTPEHDSDDELSTKSLGRAQPKKRKPVACKRVLFYGQDGSNIIYESATEAASHYGVQVETVRKYICDRMPFHGYMVAYEGDPKPEWPKVMPRNWNNRYTIKTRSPEPVTLIRYMNDGQIIKKNFPSSAAAATSLGIGAKHLGNHIRNRRIIRNHFACYTRDIGEFTPNIR